MKLFSVLDIFGNELTLTLEAFEHIIFTHPEIQGKQEEIQKTLEKPDLVKESKHDNKVRLFYKKIAAYYLVVVVKIEGNRGFVLTAYLAEKVKRGNLLWEK